jgi:copper chaperone CopZ
MRLIRFKPKGSENMKKTIFCAGAAALALLMAGCSEGETKTMRKMEKKSKPTFMLWCFRKEIVSSRYLIPKMTTPQAANLIRNRLKGIPGYVDSNVDFETSTLTVSYEGSVVRKMNFEEAIAQIGFNVNLRPANPSAKIPEGIL